MPLKAALQALKVAVQRPTLKMVNNTLQGDLVTQEAHAGMDNRVWGLLKGACFGTGLRVCADGSLACAAMSAVLG